MRTSAVAFAAAIEPMEGVAVSLTDADLLPAVRAEFVAPRYSRRGVRRRLRTGRPGYKPNIGGGGEASLDVVMELANHEAGNIAVVEPAFSRLLQACGMRHVQGHRTTISDSWTSGTQASHGATFTSTTGKVGRILATVREGEDTHLVYETGPGVAPLSSADLELTVVRGSVTEAVIARTGGTNTDAHAWSPWHIPVSSIEVDAVSGGTISHGEQLTGAASGAVGFARNQDALAVPYGTRAMEYSLADPTLAFLAGEAVTASGGASATVDAGASQTQVHLPSLTVGAFLDGQYLALRGARGSWGLTHTSPGSAELVFKLRGVPVDPEDAEARWSGLPWDGQRAGAPATTQGQTFTLDGEYAPRWTSLEYESRSAVEMRHDPYDDQAYLSAVLSDWDYQMRLDPEAQAEAVWATWAKQRDQTPVRARHVIGPHDGADFWFETRVENAQLADIDQRPRRGRAANHITASIGSDATLHGGGELVLLLYGPTI